MNRAVRILRRGVLGLLSRVNPGDVTVRHHYTGEKIRVHSFRHRGYWFYGHRREAATMKALATIVQPGDSVLEIGGHVGYVALHLAQLAGPTGRVAVLEPGANNLPYLRQNVAGRANVLIIEKAAGDHGGTMTLFEEDLTGQNNSLIPNFDGLRANQAAAVRAHVTPTSVEVVSVDSLIGQLGVPRLLMIDVEGFENEVLLGSMALLRERPPVIMVEIQRKQPEIFEMLIELGYRLFHPTGEPVGEPAALDMNTFCLHEKDHRDTAIRLGWRLDFHPPVSAL